MCAFFYSERGDILQHMIFMAVIPLWHTVCMMALTGIPALMACFMLICLSRKRGRENEAVQPQLPEPVKEPAEKEVMDLAYAVILRRVTERVLSRYPDARWVWEAPDARWLIETEGEAYILLNRAGGYRRARVILKNLQVKGIDFCPLKLEPEAGQEPETIQGLEAEDEPEAEEALERQEPQKENYELLAFEWAEAHGLELNERCNEAIGQGLDEMILEEGELPVYESWPDLCRELVRLGFQEVHCIPEGIWIDLRQETAERK